MKKVALLVVFLFLSITIYADATVDFIISAKNGDIAKITELLKTNIDLNCTDENGKTALMWASEKGYNLIVSLLIEKSANVNLAAKSGYTALHYASQAGKTDIVKLLIAAKDITIINTQATNGWTPLICASSMSRYDIVKILLENGADKSIKDKKGFSAKIYAEIMGTKELVKLLE